MTERQRKVSVLPSSRGVRHGYYAKSLMIARNESVSQLRQGWRLVELTPLHGATRSAPA